MTSQALRDQCQEAERRRDCVSVAETVLGTTDEEAIVAKAVVMVAQTELIGKLDFTFSRICLK